MDLKPPSSSETPTMLTPELWSHVFSFCREPRNLSGQFQPQSTLVALTTVSTTFYHAAYPYLYSHVSVHNLPSFFRGSQPPSLPSSTSPSSSIPTKNDLLRCVRSLHICSPTPKVKAEDDTSDDGTDSEGKAEEDLETIESREREVLQADQLRRFINYLLDPCPTLDTVLRPSCGSPPNPLLLPNILHIQYDRTEHDPEMNHTEHERTYMNESYLPAAIAQLSNPKHWCEDEKSIGVGLVSTSNTPILSYTQIPAFYYNHFDVTTDFLWGTNNIGYAIERPTYLDILRRSNLPEYVQEVSRIFQYALERARDLQPSRRKDHKRRAAQATTVTVYGFVPAVVEKEWLIYGSLPSLFGEDDGTVEDPKDVEEDRRRAENMARMEARRLMDEVQANVMQEIELTEEHDRMDPSKLVLKGAWEAEPCPCCGRACVDV